MKKSLFKVKLHWFIFFLILFSTIYLSVYYFTGSNYQAYRLCLLVLSVLALPIIVIFTHTENNNKPLIYHEKNNNDNYEDQQLEPQHRYKYVYGSSYEKINVHF